MPSPAASDTDSDVPETVTLAESKRSAKRKNEDVEKAHAAQRKKTKLKNQERDKLLKGQAERRKAREKGKEEAESFSVEARMERAMKEAKEESEEAASQEEGERIGSAGIEENVETDSEEQSEEWKGIQEVDSQMDEDENSASESDEDSGEGSSLGEDPDGLDEAFGSRTGSLPGIKKTTDRLPDHIFEAAFASHQKAQQVSLKNTDTATVKPEKATKEKKRKNKSKDIIIGSKTIRTISSTLQASKAGAHVPTPKVQRYIDRTLSLKGGNSTVKGWQRRPANIGVFKQNGPAQNFVRS